MWLLMSCLLAAAPAPQSGVPAEAPPSFSEPVEPFRVAGNVYYVGTRELASYLLTSPRGHILIDSGIDPTGLRIRQSIERLGFALKDVRVILSSHAHIDHAAGLAALKAKSSAGVMALEEDADLLAAGGRGDVLFGDRFPFPPVVVDRRLKDGDEVRVGSTVVSVHRTAGHTPGSATWTLKTRQGGRELAVVFAASLGMHQGVRLLDRPSYPGIAADYEASFARLKSLHADIFLSTHGSAFDLDAKRKRVAAKTVNAFEDPAGYRAYVARMEDAFRTQRGIEAAAARDSEAARVVVLEPLAGQERQFEAGYKRHLEWHRAAGDAWRWHGWQIVSGERVGFFMDGTFGHRWEDFDAPVQPAADAADNATNVGPFARVRSNAYWRLRRDLSTVDPLERGTPSPLMEVTYVTIAAANARAFEDAVARLPGNRTVYELVNGGRGLRYMMLFPRANMKELGAGEALHRWTTMAESVYRELLQYREDMSYPGRR